MENKIRLENEISEETFIELKGKFSHIVNSQNGSRILQTYIFRSNIEIVGKIFREVCDHLPSIITNVYGNYFGQKFFLTLNDDDRLIFLKRVNFFYFTFFDFFFYFIYLFSM